MPEEFPWLSLDPDEEVVWSGTPRLHVVLPVVLGAVVVAGLAIVAAPQTWIGALAVLAGLAMIGVAVTYVRNVEFVVSTKYLYQKRGVLGRAVTQVGLQNVQDATLRQGVFGTQFGHGTISFSTAGGDGDELRMYAIGDPTTVKARVDEHVAKARSAASGSSGLDGVGGPTRGQRDSPGESQRSGTREQVETVLSEARALRAVAERLDQSITAGSAIGTVGDGRERRDGRDAGRRAPDDSALSDAPSSEEGSVDTSTDGGAVDGGEQP